MNPMKWLTREKALWLAGIFIFLGLATDWFGFVGTTWKEEVRLHDGSLLVVERSFHLKGRHEIGQSPPIGEQSIAFNLPGTDKAIVWKDEYSKELGRANFVLVALHIFNGVPYLITTANGCLSSNKWGRPNPPYVIFKYKEKKWERIGLNDLPSELRTR